jgi:hypothetical protein
LKTFAPGQNVKKTFYIRNLLIFIIILSVCTLLAFPSWSNVWGKGQKLSLEWHTNALAYSSSLLVKKQKSFIALTPEGNVIKTFFHSFAPGKLVESNSG